MYSFSTNLMGDMNTVEQDVIAALEVRADLRLKILWTSNNSNLSGMNLSSAPK